MRTIGLVLETFGTVFLILAVNVVREYASERTVSGLRATREAITRWRGRLVAAWRRLRHPHVHYATGDASMTFSGTATATVTTYRVDRNTVSDRDWLTHLDDVVFALRELLDQSTKARADELAETHARIDRARDDVLAVTRQGWQYAVVGGVLSVAGIIITAFA